MSDDGGLRPLFRTRLRKFHWVAIESWTTGSGIPDANYCSRSSEGWIEFKRAKANAVRFRPGQVAWLEQRRRAGGRAFVAVRRMAKEVDDLFLYSADQARQVALAGLATPPLLLSSGGPAQWRWEEVEAILLT